MTRKPRCPKCKSEKVLASGPIQLEVQEIGTRMAIGIPYGTGFPISRASPAACNKYGCGWQGTVAELDPEYKPPKRTEKKEANPPPPPKPPQERLEELEVELKRLRDSLRQN